MFNNKEWLYDQICVQRKTFTRVALETGHNRQVLSKLANEFGIQKPAKIYCDKEWLYDQYYVQRKTFSKIAAETGATFDTISRWIKKFDFKEIRDLYRNKEWLFDQYCNKKRKLEDISEECDTSRGTVMHWVKKYCFKRRRLSSYSVNESYFNNIDTQEKAYWLGFLAADGCVLNRTGKRMLLVSLAKKDENHLALLSRCLGSSKPMYHCKNGSVQMCICSVVMAQDLVNHGIVERKSLILKSPNITQELIRHWIRGYFDGDGSVGKDRHNNLRGDVVGTLEVMNFIKSNCDAFCGPYKKVNVYALCFGGNNKARTLYDYLYHNSNICLGRKKQIFEN